MYHLGPGWLVGCISVDELNTNPRTEPSLPLIEASLPLIVG